MDAGVRVHVFAGGAFVVLGVAVFVLGNEEPDGALVQPAGVCGVQAVAAGPRTRPPRLNDPVSGPAALLGAARQQPVGRARGLPRGAQLPG